MEPSKRNELSKKILDTPTERYCEIYKITNLTTSKKYIGQAVSHILNNNKYNIYYYKYNIFNSKLFNLKINPLINNFFIFLIYKIINDNFNSKVNLFFSDIYIKYLNKNNLNDNIINAISDLFILAYDSITDINLNNENKQIIDILNSEDIKNYYNSLIDPNIIHNYKIIEKNIIKLFKSFNPTIIKLNYNVQFHGVNKNVNIICDNILINMFISDFNIANINNITEILLCSYLFKKNNYLINNNILFNPLTGEINDFNISNIDLLKFKKIIYNN